MIAASTINEIRQAVAEARSTGRKIGLVPTMGALHAGHFSLVDAARRDCSFVVVSIFVNPIQFGPREDFSKYPRPVERDLAGCRQRGVDAVFMPEPAMMYPEGFATTVHVSGLTEGLCGASRPGHFDGVCTVVCKLLNIVAPEAAYFGAKDYQQAAVVRRMAADLNLPVQIVVCPTVREPDGLAMSSRNAYLTAEERSQAAALNQALRLAETLIRQGHDKPAVLADAIAQHLAARAPLGRIEYVQIVDPEALWPVESAKGPVVIALAVRFPSARLIDNIRVDAVCPGL